MKIVDFTLTIQVRYFAKIRWTVQHPSVIVDLFHSLANENVRSSSVTCSHSF
jgi:hypothetical protein